MKLEATWLRDRRYAVRPEGCVGTCGSIGNMVWQVIYLTASSPTQAVYRAHKAHWWTREEIPS